MIRVRVRGRVSVGVSVGVGVGVWVRVTKLVYQIGFTTPFQVSRTRKYFSSKQQASSKQAEASSN